MRNIKFRAWDKLNGQMLDVYKIDFLFNKHVTFADEDSLSLEYVELMQYTGLKDKNGVEIYEGDILKVYDDFRKDNPVGVVNFNCGSFILNGTYMPKTREHYHLATWNNFEVIGNIYETPLKEE